jgi:hypothetical protein
VVRVFAVTEVLLLVVVGCQAAPAASILETPAAALPTRLETFSAKKFEVAGPAGSVALGRGEPTAQLEAAIYGAWKADPESTFLREMRNVLTNYPQAQDGLTVVNFAMPASSGEITGGTVLSIWLLAKQKATFRAGDTLRVHLNDSAFGGARATDVETRAVPVGQASAGALVFDEGHVVHRGYVVAERGRLFSVDFATIEPYDRSRPTFDAILESITLLE